MADPIQQPVDTNTMIDQPTGAPVSQPAPAAAAPTPTTPTTPTPAPGAAAPAPQPQQHPVMRVMDSILKGATGGDVYYTDENGQRKLAPQSRGTLGKTLIAATLAGLLAPDKYVQTPYGPRRDFTGSAGNAMEASQNVVNEARQQPQKLSNEAQARKMLTLQNNSQLVALQSAQARLASEANDYRVKTAAHVDEMFQPFKDYEESRTGNNDPNQPKAFIDGGRGLSHEQAEAMIKQKGNGFTENNIIQDGWTDKWDAAANRMIPEPTYAILNPDLKEVTLSPAVADVLARVNSQYKDIHQKVGGDLKVPVNAYVSAMHDYQAVLTGQQVLDGINTAIGGSHPVTQADIEKVARDGRANGANVLPLLYSLTHAVAGGQIPDQRPDNLLDVILQHGGSATTPLLKLIGLTPQEAAAKAEDISNKRISANKLAQEGGMGPKAPASQEQVNQVIDNYKTNTDLTDNDRKTIAPDIPSPDADGVIHMTNDQVAKVENSIREMTATNKGITEKNLLANGDPVQLQKTANNTIEGDVANITKVVGMRGNARENAVNAIHDEAVKRGLDSTQYSEAKLQVKADMLEDYASNKKSSTGAQLTSFDAFLKHVSGAVDAEKALEGKTIGLTRTPWANAASDVIGKQFANSPEWAAYKTSLLPVQNEINNFLAAGYAPKENEQQLMNQVLDPHETPARVTAAIRELAKVADARLASMGQKYLDNMGTAYPTLLSADSRNSLKRLNIKSQAEPLSVALPRGWKNNQFQPLTDLETAKAYIRAAGGDTKRAQDLAKENGWILQ